MTWQLKAPDLPFDVVSIEANAPDQSGIYGCRNHNRWVYIGDTFDIRGALLNHEKAGFGAHTSTHFTYELWPPEVRRAKAWNCIVDCEPACNTELKHSSDELFHFVGFSHPKDRDANYAILRNILKEKQLRRPSWPGDPRLVALAFQPTESLRLGELMVSNTICFCDIRRNELGIHVRKYGEFGLSYHRGFLMRHGCRPVTYVPCYLDDYLSIHGRTLIKNILAAYSAINDLELSDRPSAGQSRTRDSMREKNEAVEAMVSVYQKDFMAFIKAYDANLSEDHIQNFFLEREWRRYGALEFQPDQVVRVVVAQGFAERAKRDLAEYADRVDEISSDTD